MKVEIVNNSETPAPRSFLLWWVKALIRGLPEADRKRAFRDGLIYLVFLDEKSARKLNREFRGKDRATDVLSFSGVEPGSLGELVFAPDVLKIQAREHGLSYRFELGYMVIHGVLHLLGYEHEGTGFAAKRRQEKMFALQDLLFERLCHSWNRR